MLSLQNRLLFLLGYQIIHPLEVSLALDKHVIHLHRLHVVLLCLDD